jgi:hypothetical protein
MLTPRARALEDNRAVDKDSNLLPRILGRLSMAAVAIAVTVGSAAATPPTAPSSQIWECTTNGQRTFSDKPCGVKSSLRELNPINGMDPTPILPPAPSYQPRFVDPPEYSNPGPQESAENSYPVLVAFPYNVRRPHDRAHRPHKHGHGPAPRRN